MSKVIIVLLSLQDIKITIMGSWGDFLVILIATVKSKMWPFDSSWGKNILGTLTELGSWSLGNLGTLSQNSVCYQSL